MSRSMRASAMSRVFVLALTLVMLAGLPAEAASTWTKLLTTPGEVQRMAPAPGNGVYVATSPTNSGATAVLYRYKSDGKVSWKVTLGTGGVYITGLASDASGNAYVMSWSTTRDGDKGYPYRLQHVKKDGKLGWLKTWYDDDLSLSGGPVALSGNMLLVAQRDAATGNSTIRRFKKSNGAASSTWTLSGSKKPASWLSDLVVHAGSAYMLDVSGRLFRLRTDGTVQWMKQLPGTPGGGAYLVTGNLAVNAKGISVGYNEGCCDAYVRRYTLSGTQKWSKRAPNVGGSALSVTVAGANTFTATSKWVSDAKRSQIIVTRMDANGKVKGSVKAGTKETDSPSFALASGGYVYVGGYAWTSPNRPLVVRVKKP
ncbi:MAG: PQQ-like beta-propeller repeat protein [Chloroflexi bacterium]|nr:PQQ-like beta-propeller repeat protein [Chloroflexota bacterium]